ncbi:hypothetical protein LCGC14_0145040 [marine sediment metagenome]|uniref:Uncharacterized protein n=1 Tax=marine sediment metagenome TaxID=412755 RepID=A0A0F9VF60_9ZZZZ
MDELIGKYFLVGSRIGISIFEVTNVVRRDGDPVFVSGVLIKKGKKGRPKALAGPELKNLKFIEQDELKDAHKALMLLQKSRRLGVELTVHDNMSTVEKIAANFKDSWIWGALE